MKYIALITSFLTSLTGQAQILINQNTVSNSNTSNQEDTKLSEFEQRQRLITRVLQKNEVKKELFGNYKASLLKISAQDKDVQKWLEDVDQYLNSSDFKNRSVTLKAEELADNRLLIEMTAKKLF